MVPKDPAGQMQSSTRLASCLISIVTLLTAFTWVRSLFFSFFLVPGIELGTLRWRAGACAPELYPWLVCVTERCLEATAGSGQGECQQCATLPTLEFWTEGLTK